MRPPSRDLRWLYCVLVGVRVAFAFSPGYIHPDEWFQFGEVLSGDLFSIDVLKTWEFDPAYPCRSMASIRLFGLPFLLLGREPSPWALFATSRSIFLALSFLLDYSVWQLLTPSRSRWSGMTLLAGSGAVLSFSVRSFSNNIESALLALSFVCIQRLSALKSTGWSAWSCLLGVLTAAGVFSRFTFVIFALPLGLAYLRLARKGSKLALPFCRSIAPAFICAVTVALLHVLYDTWYYSSSGSLWPLTVVPINAALYNLKRENLATHGIHPRYLHALVNAPLLLGLGPWLAFVSSTFRRQNDMHTQEGAAVQNAVLRSTVIFSILVLSLQPHQEPRFLLPLVIPVCVLFATSRARSNRLLLYTTIVQNIAVAVFFCFFHQAGTVPAMLDVSSKLNTMTSVEGAAPIVHILFWRSFMPPRHLVISSAKTSTVVIVEDCQSMTVDTVTEHILATQSKSIVLFAPSWVLDPVTTATLEGKGVALRPFTRHYPHLDTDHLSESFKVSREAQSFLSGFSFAGYLVDR